MKSREIVVNVEYFVLHSVSITLIRPFQTDIEKYKKFSDSSNQ